MSTSTIPVLDSAESLSTSGREASERVRRCSPLGVVAVLLLADTLALGISVALSVLLKSFLTGPVSWGDYLSLWPAISVFVAVYAAAGLYSVIALSTPEEIRRVTISSAVVFVLLAAMTVSQRGSHSAVTWTLVLAILLTVALIPLLRSASRRLFGKRGWWGYPAVLFGSSEGIVDALSSLSKYHGGGLIPVAIAVEHPRDAGPLKSALPVVADSELQSLDPAAPYAIVLAANRTMSQVMELIERRCGRFPKVIVLEQFGSLTPVGMESRHLAGQCAMHVSRDIYAYRSVAIKGMLDRVVAAAALVLLAPVFVLAALAVFLESGRPVFFGHRRIGKGGLNFPAWKFRTMVKDADAALKQYLEKHPEARREWEINHKLRDDPRVTRVGEWLRKTSLDELPQLYNVVKGEMSIVGPRPVVDAEVTRYGEGISLYYRVKGGITGLWQVSGRNDTTYEQRVALDLHYIRNWSVWLDLFIMARTVTAVLFRRGAY